MADPKQLIAQLEVLQGARRNFDTLWDRVQPLLWPDGSTFLTHRSDGEITTREVFSSAPSSALEKFVSAMSSYLVPQHLRWHGLRASIDELNEDREVKAFFEQLTTLLFKMRAVPAARFYGQMGENLKSLGAYGNGNFFVDGGRKGKGIRYKHISIGKCWIETDYTGVVDTLFYKYMLSAHAAAQKWPHAVPEKAAVAIARGKMFEEHEYIHCVQPNPKYDPEKVTPDGMAFSAWDIAVDSQAFIPTELDEEKGGYFEFPYIWSRFTLNPDEVYGRGPGMLSLPANLTLQSMEKTFLRSGHKVADPPLLVAHDGRLGRGRRKIRLAAGGLNYGAVDEAGRAKIIPLQTGARLDITLEMMDRKNEEIMDAFFVNVFDIFARDRVEMTATEVIARGQEKGQLITPVVSRQQTELLGPMIERELGILGRQGMLPEMPPALIEAEGEFTIEYDSLATRLQQSDEIASYQRLVEVFRPQIELDPTIAQVLKAEDAIRAFGESMGIRSVLFNSKDEMKQIRDEQAQAAQMQQMADQAPPIAQAAKMMSEIPVEEQA